MSDWPKGAPMPTPDDIVQVLMREDMARHFERMLEPRASLAGPLLFREDDLPTYIIQPEADR